MLAYIKGWAGPSRACISCLGPRLSGKDHRRRVYIFICFDTRNTDLRLWQRWDWLAIGPGIQKLFGLAGWLVSFVMFRPKMALLQCTNIEPGVWRKRGMEITSVGSLDGVYMHIIEQSQLI
jgi:hypothetical protein